MKSILFALIFLLTAFSFNIYAHGKEHDKHKKVKADTLTIVDGDTIAVNGHPKNYKMPMMTKEEMQEEKFELKPSEEIFEHLHNKIVHFPIAIGVIAFFFSLLHLRRKNYNTTILILVVLGLAFSVLAFFTGLNQVQPFEGTNKYWVVELHRNFGISILITYFIWLFFLLVDKIKKYAWIIGAIIFVLILITAFLGGVIAH
ncbi:MAG: hypothetical protein FIA82_02850 [Melioribacter sp.]|nr:hypothetical protein [Melioribacter sp.]